MVKHFYITSTKKQVLTTHTNLLRFCFLGTTPKLTIAPEDPTQDLKTARLGLYLTIMATTSDE